MTFGAVTIMVMSPVNHHIFMMTSIVYTLVVFRIHYRFLMWNSIHDKSCVTHFRLLMAFYILRTETPLNFAILHCLKEIRLYY